MQNAYHYYEAAAGDENDWTDPQLPLPARGGGAGPSNYNAFNGINDNTLDGINDSTLDGLNDFDVDALADGDFDFTKFTQEVNQTPFLSHDNTLHPPIGATEEESPLPATPGTSLPPSHRFSCRHCATTCARRGDLRRHELKHRRFKAFDCPNHGCLRKGDRAFERKDKMESHRRVCRAGATAAQSED
ncbi:MAG: hypothetical protein L6R35_006560 [Caloplaca aegaea]|nr:MAG: hypothetical protein L6R35_006560 [Caloplaca aegaea]